MSLVHNSRHAPTRTSARSPTAEADASSRVVAEAATRIDTHFSQSSSTLGHARSESRCHNVL